MKFYDPQSVTIALGPHIMSGFGDGSFVTISKTTDDYTTTNGSDGLVTRNTMQDRRATITITLQHTSDSNSYLLASRNLGLPQPLIVKDLLGSTLCTAASVWVQKVPDIDFDREATSRSWTLETDALVYLSM